MFLLIAPVYAQEKETTPQTQSKPSRFKVMPENEIEELLKMHAFIPDLLMNFKNSLIPLAGLFLTRRTPSKSINNGFCICKTNNKYAKAKHF